MEGRRAKLMTHPLFIMSAPKAHYPLFNLVEKSAYPRRQKACGSPSWSPKARNEGQFKKRPHQYPGSRAGNGRDMDAGLEEEEGVVCGGTWVPVDDALQHVEFCEISEEDEFLDDGLSLGGEFPREEIDMNRLCFDDDIGCNSRYLDGRDGRVFSDGLKSRSNLAKTAAQIMVALQKTEEEIRKLEQIALAEGTRLSRQGSLTRGWADASHGMAGGDDTGFFTPESGLETAEGECWQGMNAALAQLIHQERMLPPGRTTAGDKKVHFKSNSISGEGEEAARLEILQSARAPLFYSADDGDVPTRRHSEEFVSERDKAIRASKMGASPDDRSSASTPSRPSFTLDESRSARLFSVEKLNADLLSSSCPRPTLLQDTQFRSLAAKDARGRPVPALQDHALPATGGSSNKQAAADCGGCKCIQDNPLAVRHARRSNLEASKSDTIHRRVFTPDRSDSSGKGGRRSSLLAEKKTDGSQDGSSPLRHERETVAQSRMDGGASRGSFKDSPLSRADKPEPLQVKLAAPQSPLRSGPCASPSRFSVSSRGRDTGSGPCPSPMRSRTRMRVVKLRLMSPFQLLRKLKEVCTRLILAASSSVKPDPVVVDTWTSVPNRPSTSSSCSFASVAPTPARISCSQAGNSPRIGQRRSSAGSKPCRGSPHVSSPAVSRHSFYSEAISDCIEFIKRSSTPDARMM